ncbi:hypothetical protein RN04_14380 [Arthrobacter sp. W1]|nr:hypothetical protein RN04_14380 [Arthrobacter sp. W1]
MLACTAADASLPRARQLVLGATFHFGLWHGPGSDPAFVSLNGNDRAGRSGLDPVARGGISNQAGAWREGSAPMAVRAGPPS